ncbi:MAG: hypothetical protein AAGA97_03220 [Pseudomonadota bacterium]
MTICFGIILDLRGNLQEGPFAHSVGFRPVRHSTPHTSLGGLAPAVCANLNRATRPASLENRKGSAQQALVVN